MVIDDVLVNPQALIDWAAGRSFEPPGNYPYPGLVLDPPTAVTHHMSGYFAVYARSRLGGRRTQSTTVRFSMVTVPAAYLQPIQWQCHRDRLAIDPERILFAASVLYLFCSPALGGTSFYEPRQSEAQISRMIADTEALSATEFSARYGLQPGYMAGSNAYFERVAQVPAAWNRMILYDGSLFHSADITDAAALSQDPRSGRLTLNGFYACSRAQG